MRVLTLLLALVLAGTSAAASPEDIIPTLAAKQVSDWRQAVVDTDILGGYYTDHGGQSLWIENGQPSVRAVELVDAIKRAAEDGLEASDYLPGRLTILPDLAGDRDAAGFELAMSQAFILFARDLHAGRTSPSVSAPDIVIARKPVEPGRWLAAVRENGVEAALGELRPKHPQYFQLRRMLAGYRTLVAKGGWGAVDGGPTLKPGMTDPRVGQMRTNLVARGYSGISGSDPEFYDDDLVAAVKHFQKRHGLDVDGFAGPATVAALNVPAEERVNQIIVNMERWRWLPVDLGKRHVFVNQAAFEMFFVRGGETVDNRRIIVGKPFHKSPMFSDLISYAEFNPTWTVTPNIARNEFLPKLRRDPGYMARNNYLLYAGWSANSPVVDPYSVDWNSVSPREFGYRIVQQPGPKNALGRVKFIFPNKFNVYLHDTPSRQLFASTGRAFSHGCIRVQGPIKFAEKLFAADGTLTPGGIKSILQSGKTSRSLLKTKVPVHLAYFTAWIDADGLPHFFADVYGRDELVSRILFESA